MTEWHEDPEVQDIANVTRWRLLSSYPTTRFIFYRHHIKWWHLYINSTYKWEDIEHDQNGSVVNLGVMRGKRIIWAEKKTGKGLVPVSPSVAKALLLMLWPDHAHPVGNLPDEFPDKRP